MSGAWMPRGSPCVMCVKVTDSLSLSPSAYTRLSLHLFILARVGERVVPFRWRLKWLIVTSLFVSPPPALSTLEISQRVGNKAQERAGGGGRNDGSVSITQQTWARILMHPSRRNMKSKRQSAQLGKDDSTQLQGWNKGVS